jgi:hypothetical protein
VHLESGSLAIKPEAAKRSRYAKHKNTNGKGQRDFGHTPAELLRDRCAENAPRINHAQCDLQKGTCDGDTPTVPHDFFNPIVLIEFAYSDFLMNGADVRTLARSRGQRPKHGDYLY